MDDLRGAAIVHEPVARPSPIGGCDEELLALVARGDYDAFAQLYDRYGRLAFAIAYRIVGDRAGAEDAVLAAFLSARRGSASFDASRGSVRAWLLGLARNAAVDGRRGQQRLAGRDAVLDDHAFRWACGEDDSSTAVAGIGDSPQVRSALAALPSEQRNAIELAYFGGLTNREISERTGAPPGEVSCRLRHGLWALRACLVISLARDERLVTGSPVA